MVPIKISNNNEIVKIKITIAYSGIVKYSFALSSEKSINYPPIPKPKKFKHEYEIGKGSLLLEDENCINSLTMELLNPTTKDLEYELFIDWFQGSKDEPIYTWPIKAQRNGIVKDKPKFLEANFKYVLTN